MYLNLFKVLYDNLIGLFANIVSRPTMHLDEQYGVILKFVFLIKISVPNTCRYAGHS